MLFPSSGVAQGLIFSNPRPTLLDANGAVLNGAKLCTYQAGTTTPLNTYSDSGLSVANTNPLVTNAAGRLTSNSTEVTVYLLKQSYKFVLLTAGSDGTCATGTTLWTADNQPGGYDGSVLVAGTLNTARLGSGSATAATFLSGASTWVQTSQPPVLITTTGTVNNWAPGVVSGAINTFLCNGATDLTITGISSTGIAAGTVVILKATSTGNVYTAHANGGSLGANQFTNAATSGNTPISFGGYAFYIYDAVGSVWRLYAHDQGAFIDYGATSTIVGWTSFTTKSLRYRLAGKTLTFMWDLEGTSNSTSTSFTLPLTVVNAGSAWSFPSGAILDNGATTTTTGRNDINANTSTVSCFIANAGTGWTASGTKITRGGFTIEVQ